MKYTSKAQDPELWRVFCESLLGTIAGAQDDEAIERELALLTGYRSLKAIPAERRARIEAQLWAEAEACRLMGAGAFAASKTLSGKIKLYRAALEEIERRHGDGAGGRVTFAQFRALLNEEFSNARKSEPQSGEQLTLCGRKGQG